MIFFICVLNSYDCFVCDLVLIVSSFVSSHPNFGLVQEVGVRDFVSVKGNFASSFSFSFNITAVLRLNP